ncbi:SGNH/GDSL hydrolase family protein [Pseudoduganella namucuonensis]|uniref:GDSL-like Lipase/Acylhydrolase family protein n=1 Tax=Pseudoduganella namucuonensis TaxID=1035707 RepID=A0A1I7HMU2_9BURK|nr:SGNH/GDSL hydrolase family protein [Pseudoduganella namucuonensis]SFU62012.1 GDSL-like Lipase/Acylhydrolase family protein [Pseudoduganella namucuonensis]
MRGIIAALLGALAAGAAFAGKPSVSAVAAPPTGFASLPASIGGRVSSEGAAGGYKYQWPGAYFETAFEGRSLYFRVGPGDVNLRVTVDAQEPATLSKPAPGWYVIEGLDAGAHTVRVAVANESQAGPNLFGGFALAPDARPLPAPRRARQIEFIGDSHTVGYGNTSAERECNDEKIWSTTDNTQGLGALTAARYNADYRVHAISGRGIVRNFNGFAGDPLPVAYPFILFDKATRDTAASWRPQLIVISLGTNDFSTPLNPGEKWKTRAELHADYEASYVQFVHALRARNPQAHFLLWSTDGANGEIQAEVKAVVARLKAAGEDRVGFIAVNGLTFSGCNWHPSVADDRTISDALIQAIEANPAVWKKTD